MEKGKGKMENEMTHGALPTLDVAVVTVGEEGIRRVAAMLPPAVPGIGYVVSWQKSGDTGIPPSLLRSDVKVVRPDTVGSSVNRNNALANCERDIVVFLDDDVTVYPEGLQRLRLEYKLHPDADLITFQGTLGQKVFPGETTVLQKRLPKGYYVSGCEISERRERAAGLQFDTRLGICAPRYTCGEDEVFALNAIERGLKCLFVPVRVCMHAHESTGTRRCPPKGVLRGMGLVAALYYGPMQTALRLPLKAWRMWRVNGSNPLAALWYLSQGALGAIGFRREKGKGKREKEKGKREKE